jgi:hypothetical protein
VREEEVEVVDGIVVDCVPSSWLAANNSFVCPLQDSNSLASRLETDDPAREPFILKTRRICLVGKINRRMIDDSAQGRAAGKWQWR